MAKKKTISELQKQKLVRAQHKNDFFRRLDCYITVLCGKNIFSLIPKYYLENIYATRIHAVKFQADKGHDIPIDIIRTTQKVFHEFMKTRRVSISESGPEICINDYHQIILAIFNLQSTLKEDEFPAAKAVLAGLRQFNAENCSFSKKFDNLFIEYLDIAGYLCSNIGSNLYWFHHEFEFDPTISTCILNSVKIQVVHQKSIPVTIGGNTRPAWRVGWVFAQHGFAWISIKPSVLNIKSPFAEISLDVYIQSHALARLKERIDCYQLAVIQLSVFFSLSDPNIFYDVHNNLLIEFRIYMTKAGYFRADIIDGVIVIRTFLFVTNASTPEGQRLEKHTGLQKIDTKYLALDKLSTFMNSDIGENKEIRKIFENAGCKCLYDLHDTTQQLSTKNETILISDLMVQYMAKEEQQIAQEVEI